MIIRTSEKYSSLLWVNLWTALRPTAKVVWHFTLRPVPPSKVVWLLPYLPNRFRRSWFNITTIKYFHNICPRDICSFLVLLRFWTCLHHWYVANHCVKSSKHAMKHHRNNKQHEHMYESSTVNSTYMHSLGTTGWLACKRSVHLTVVSL